MSIVPNFPIPPKTKKLLIVGDGEQAEIAYEYFTYDSPYEVAGFAVESAFRKKDELYELPVVDFESMERRFKPSEYSAYVAISSTHLNRVRARLFQRTKEKGFTCASYLSSKAFCWRNVEIGENSFIFENNVLQHHVRVGDNVILWSGNHVGHRTVIHDHCFISSHVVISGFCEIGRYTFMGVNSCVGNDLKVGEDNVIGSGAVVVKNTDAGKVYVGNPAKALEKSSFDTFKVPEGAR